MSGIIYTFVLYLTTVGEVGSVNIVLMVAEGGLLRVYFGDGNSRVFYTLIYTNKKFPQHNDIRRLYLLFTRM